jgi:transcriptional regulator NrdR family protein
MGMLTSSKRGITCPDCDAGTRVLETAFTGGRAHRQRLCKHNAHLFATQEVPIREEHQGETEGQRGYPCTRCGGPTSVLQTRNAIGMVKRKRCCNRCAHVFTTKEYPEP